MEEYHNRIFMLTIRLMDNGMQASGKLGSGFNEDMFLFVESPDKQKKAFLCDLCGSTLLTTLRPIEGRLCGES